MTMMFDETQHLMPGRFCLGQEDGCRAQFTNRARHGIEGDAWRCPSGIQVPFPRDRFTSETAHAQKPAMQKPALLKSWPCSKTDLLKKNEQGSGPCSENCVDPLFPASSDLIFFGGVTLLVRARAPPETWTTRLSHASA
jgi:hypothetical protein